MKSDWVLSKAFHQREDIVFDRNHLNVFGQGRFRRSALGNVRLIRVLFVGNRRTAAFAAIARMLGNHSRTCNRMKVLWRNQMVHRLNLFAPTRGIARLFVFAI
eukprot:jgi/Psemu1/38260/gm1.38260_g